MIDTKWNTYEKLIEKYKHGEIKANILVKKITKLLQEILDQDVDEEIAICEIVGYDANLFERLKSECKRKVYIYE